MKTRPNGVPKIGKKRRKANLNDPEKLQELVATLWLYLGRHAETQLTTEQKELYADCVEAQDRSTGELDARWWRR